MHGNGSKWESISCVNYILLEVICFWKLYYLLLIRVVINQQHIWWEMSTLVNSNTTIHQQHSWQSKGQTFDEFIIFLEKKYFSFFFLEK